jgi:TRAP-type C4-dicarboxylate transport system substrate-binding protein
MRPGSIRLWAASTALCMTVLACSEPTGEDKAGTETIVLEFASINGETNMGDGFVDIDAFADHIEEVSDGLIQVDIAVSYGEGAADAEARLIEAIASGTVDGGNPAVRAFSRAGISGLEMLEAPMTLSSFAVLKELVASPLAGSFLDRLDGSGLVGLGLVVGDLRRPFAVDDALLGPDDWDGVRFRTFGSDIQGESVRALGGTPVDAYADAWDQIAAGTLDGIENGIIGYQVSGRTTEVGHVTANVVLWPKVPVLVLSRGRWDSLSEEQREWITEAAELTVARSVDIGYDETEASSLLCAQGVRFYDASQDQLDGLRQSFASVYSRFEDDSLWPQVQALASGYPDAEKPEIPAECMGSPGVASEAPEIPEEVSAIPDGLYRVEIAVSDVDAAGLSNGLGWSGTWTIEIADGTYALMCRPLHSPDDDCGNAYEGDSDFPLDAVFEAGYVTGTDDRVFFVYDAEVHDELAGCGECFPLPTYSARWSLEGSTMTFTAGPGVPPPAHLTIKSWEKIG